MRKRRQRFTGALSAPIVVHPYFPIVLSLLAQSGEPTADRKRDKIRKDEERWIWRKRMEKLALLLDHFGIPASASDKWQRLALVLAEHSVPGMRVAPSPPISRGRKRTGPTPDEVQTAVLKIAIERQRGIRDAIEVLRKRAPSRWGKFSAAKMRSLFYEGGAVRSSSLEKFFGLDRYDPVSGNLID